MFQIDSTNVSQAQPTPGAAGLLSGWFIDEDPVSGNGGTVVSADWLNMVQGELLAFLVAAGVTPSKTNIGQVLAGAQYCFSIRAAQAYSRPVIITVPNGVWQYEAEVYGAGGGAGGSYTNQSGGGGAGGGYAWGLINTSPGSQIVINPGVAGAGGTPGNVGTPGGTSSIGNFFSATGGGAGSAGGGGNGSGGFGGIGVGGTKNLCGSDGTDGGTAGTPGSGSGGASAGGGGGTRSGTTGRNSQGFGGGGAAPHPLVADPGGNAGDGLVVVRWLTAPGR